MVPLGRKRTAVASLFKPVTDNFKMPKVKCNFCGVTVTKNRSNEIVYSKCKKCTDNIKQKYLRVSESEINEVML